MNIKFFAGLAVISLLISPCANAQFFSAASDDLRLPETPQLAKPISLFEETANANDDAEPKIAKIEEGDPDVSYYVQNLNLSEEQLQQVQKISAENIKQQEEIVQEIATLRQKAHSVKLNSIAAFEAILNDEQKAAFQKLRSDYNAAQNNAEDNQPTAPQQTF